MCHNVKTLSKVKCGELSLCCQCSIYHLEFNNIYLEFNSNAFEQFKTYVLDIDMDYWECKYASSRIKRKIPIPSMQQNLVLVFIREEIRELQRLLSTSVTEVFNLYLNSNDIDYKLILN
ncbi:DUF6686 family protein [Tamlana sp. 2201CG12-4]|uniref:DUF6686 family protein n=1 Tax=Tamlana sp. 2201CG12-4 TaxID=3112582 RepID=UPI002DBB8D04|nr:DUF6686 family protein [Tamlana sp. 2201CG12-4]MEC3906161.1 DUF6686 family protein [Tamlana sp. 2201CG12-4]